MRQVSVKGKRFGVSKSEAEAVSKMKLLQGQVQRQALEAWVNEAPTQEAFNRRVRVLEGFGYSGTGSWDGPPNAT